MRERDRRAVKRALVAVASYVNGPMPTSFALDQAVEQGCNLGSAARAGAVVICSSENDAAQRAPSRVVVQSDVGVVEEHLQTVPHAAYVRDRFPEPAVR